MRKRDIDVDIEKPSETSAVTAYIKNNKSINKMVMWWQVIVIFLEWKDLIVIGFSGIWKTINLNVFSMSMFIL